MDVETVRGRVEEIRRMADGEINVPSDGYPHHAEYTLWRDVLTAIAEMDHPASVLASEALNSLDADFSRYF